MYMVSPIVLLTYREEDSIKFTYTQYPSFDSFELNTISYQTSTFADYNYSHFYQQDSNRNSSQIMLELIMNMADFEHSFDQKTI